MPPAATVEDESDGGGCAWKEEEGCRSALSAWWSHVRYLLGLPCPTALGRLCPAGSACSSPGGAAADTVSGTLFFPSTGGDRRVRLFLQEHEAPLLVLDLPSGLGGTDIAAAGRIVLEHRREWTTGGATAAAAGGLLESPRWAAYCNGRRVQGFAVRREELSEAEGWVMEKLRAVTAGAGRLPSGTVEYLRGRFERITGSPDAESFHLLEPAGWREANGGGGGLSIFFHRI